MTNTTEPLICPHCNAFIQRTGDVLTYTRVGGMILVACASCRKILGVLPQPD
jgi:hypothetical protein